jgi:hypothetical protein
VRLNISDRGLPLQGGLMVATPPIRLGRAGDTRVLFQGADRLLVTWDGGPLYLPDFFRGAMLADGPFVCRGSPT